MSENGQWVCNTDSLVLNGLYAACRKLHQWVPAEAVAVRQRATSSFKGSCSDHAALASGKLPAETLSLLLQLPLLQHVRARM